MDPSHRDQSQLRVLLNKSSEVDKFLEYPELLVASQSRILQGDHTQLMNLSVGHPRIL